MAEYIEREAAINEQKRFCGYLDNDMLYKLEIATRRIPAADVRPVVLCRDCKCYQQSHYIDKHMECARRGFPVHSVDFCSFGEKREES